MKIENSSPEGEILNNEGNPIEGQNQPVVDNVPTEQYKSLQSEFTRSRQALIETTAIVAKNDPTYLGSIKDAKLQNAVVKQLYGFDTYDQAVAVLGKDFNAPDNSGNGDEDRTDKLERELKLIKYNSSRAEIENAIKDYKLANPNLFISAGAEDKLRDELQFISWELPANERVRRASSIALQIQIDPTNAAYQVLNMWNSGNGNASLNSEKAKADNTQKQIAAGRALFGLKDPAAK